MTAQQKKSESESVSTQQVINTGKKQWEMSVEDEQLLASKSVTLPMNYKQLKRYLPHRYPFMLVDRVTACDGKSWITGHKNISINEPFFQGHFPDEPIMPGVLIVEAMAQISGVLAFITEGITAEDGYLFLFAGVDKARFRNQVVPGDQLVLKSKLLMQKREIYKFDCKAYVDDKLAANAQLMIIRQDRGTKA